MDGRQKICIFAAENNTRMVKKILIYSFFLFIAAFSPLAVNASEMFMPEIGVEQSEPLISVQGAVVTISGAAGEKLEVVSLTGKCLMTLRIDSLSQRIELNVPKGCYILKIGKVARKVTIR